jgi:hypothetical protein
MQQLICGNPIRAASIRMWAAAIPTSNCDEADVSASMHGAITTAPTFFRSLRELFRESSVPVRDNPISSRRSLRLFDGRTWIERASLQLDKFARMIAAMRIDHLVYATPDLNLGVDLVENLLGIRPAFGGRHLGRGTHNALLSLGTDAYLEIIAPDPQQPEPPTARAFGLDRVKEPRLVSWAAKTSDVEAVRSQAEANGIHLGRVQNGSRQRPDGVALSWRYTDPAVIVADGVVPFFIDWGTSPNPAGTAPQGARLVEFRAEHPDATAVQRRLELLGIKLAVKPGPQRALIATIDCPRGRVELR